MCVTRHSPKFVLILFMPNIRSKRQQHPNIHIYLCLRDGFSQCSPLNIITMERALQNWEITDPSDLMPWPVWALHTLRTSKQKQDNSGHAQSSWQCSHLHTIKWSRFSICCVPLPLSQSPGLTFAKNLWVRYSLTSYDLSVTCWRYSTEETMIWMQYFLQSPCMQGCDAELLLSKRQIRCGLQLPKPREMQVKALSQPGQAVCVGFIPRSSHIHPTLTSSGRCLQALFWCL